MAEGVLAIHGQGNSATAESCDGTEVSIAESAEGVLAIQGQQEKIF